MEIDATAPSTTAGPGFEDVPEALELAAAEFLWAWEGMRVEARDGFTDNSVRGDKKKMVNCGLTPSLGSGTWNLESGTLCLGIVECWTLESKLQDCLGSLTCGGLTLRILAF